MVGVADVLAGFLGPLERTRAFGMTSSRRASLQMRPVLHGALPSLEDALGVGFQVQSFEL